MEKDKGFKNEDGTLICFGKAYEYTAGGREFHCAQLIGAKDCSVLLQKHCWKLSRVTPPGPGPDDEAVV
jgi:hypothetical protein